MAGFGSAILLLDGSQRLRGGGGANHWRQFAVLTEHPLRQRFSVGPRVWMTGSAPRQRRVWEHVVDKGHPLIRHLRTGTGKAPPRDRSADSACGTGLRNAGASLH